MGFIRLLLALAVIGSHAGSSVFPEFFNFKLVDGRQAVVLFFMMSGFYMAMVLKSKYVGARGIKTFYISRYLRLWPGYLVSLLFTGIANNAFVKLANRLEDTSIWTKIFVWFSNIFIFGSELFFFISIRDGAVSYDPFAISKSSNGVVYLLNHPVFTVSLELLFYILAPFFVRSIKSLFVVFFIASCYNIIINHTGNANVFFMYHVMPASFFYFALGGIAFHFYNNFKENKVKYSQFILVSISILVCPLMYNNIAVLGFLIALPILFEITKNNKADRFMGNLSFLVYILHYPILEYLSHNVKSIPAPYFSKVLAISTLIFAIIVYFLMEKRLENSRQKLVVRLLKPKGSK